MDRKVLNIGKALLVTIILSGALGWLFATFSDQTGMDLKMAEARALAEIKWARAQRDRANAEPARRMYETSAKRFDRSIVPGSAEASSK